MKSKSCFSKLILFCGNINYWEDEWNVVDAAFLGFSKAFEIFPQCPSGQTIQLRCEDLHGLLDEQDSW